MAHKKDESRPPIEERITGQWRCVTVLQLVRFETLTQWLNPLGSNLILQWFSSATPLSTDFSSMLPPPQYGPRWIPGTPKSAPQSHSQTSVYTQTAVATPRCFISAVFGGVVFTQDWQPTSYVPNMTTIAFWGEKLQIQCSEMLSLHVGKGVFHAVLWSVLLHTREAPLMNLSIVKGNAYIFCFQYGSSVKQNKTCVATCQTSAFVYTFIFDGATPELESLWGNLKI